MVPTQTQAKGRLIQPQLISATICDKTNKIQIDDIFSIYSIKNQRDLFRESKHIGDILDLCDVLNTVHIKK